MKFESNYNDRDERNHIANLSLQNIGNFLHFFYMLPPTCRFQHREHGAMGKEK